MILVRDIRLPLSAGEPQAFEKALHLARIPRSKAAHLGVARLSVDARHGQPKLVYTIAVTLKDEGEESAYAGASPCVNQNQVQAMVDNVDETLGRAGFEAKQIEGTRNSSWVLMDYGDMIVHVFDEENRLFYDLERIWRDGKVLDVNEFLEK